MLFVRTIFLVVLFLPTLTLAAMQNIDNVEAKNKFIAKAAVVDVESILEHSTAIAHIKKTITILSDKIQKDLSAKEKELKEIESELIKQRGVLTLAEYEKKVSEFNQIVSNAQQEMQKKKGALEQAHSEAISEVHKNTILVISDLSKKYGFNIVFPSSQVLFVENDLNITLEVISNLNERLKEVEVKYNID